LAASSVKSIENCQDEAFVDVKHGGLCTLFRNQSKRLVKQQANVSRKRRIVSTGYSYMEKAQYVASLLNKKLPLAVRVCWQKQNRAVQLHQTSFK
jgi:hypothetical protein